MNTILADILFDSGYLFIITGSVIALIFGLALTFMPATALKYNSKFNSNLIKSEPFFYKYAKANGAILILGSLFMFYTLATFNFNLLIPYLPGQISPFICKWLSQAGQIFFYIASAFILIFGLVILIRPSLLKTIEAAANRWFYIPSIFSFLTTNRDPSKNWISAYPRIIGLSFTLFALFILFSLLPAQL